MDNVSCRVCALGPGMDKRGGTGKGNAIGGSGKVIMVARGKPSLGLRGKAERQGHEEDNFSCKGSETGNRHLCPKSEWGCGPQAQIRGTLSAKAEGQAKLLIGKAG